jgi:hypothetical protein
MANLGADPHLVAHLKRRAGIDIDASTEPMTDPTTRRRVLADRSASWYRTQTTLEGLVEKSPMVQVHFG